jgi:hypothetical protein
MKRFVSQLSLLSSTLMILAAPAMAQFADPGSAPATEQQVQEAASPPPSGDLAAREDAGSLDTHLRLANEGVTIAPGTSIVLQYRTAPNATCTIHSENTDAVIDDERSKNADRLGRVSWKVLINKTYNSNEVPVEVSSSRFGHQETIESRIPVKVATIKKTTM